MKVYVVVDNLGYYHGIARTRDVAQDIINDMKSSGYIQGFEITEEEI
jgi:hypothetical protein